MFFVYDFVNLMMFLIYDNPNSEFYCSQKVRFKKPFGEVHIKCWGCIGS